MSITKTSSISVVIVTYNSERNISDCIKSLIKFGNKIVRNIIIIDNNSFDKTVEKVLSIKGENIELVRRKSNRGFSSSVNLGIKLSRTQFVLLLNPDTRIKKNSLSKLIKNIKDDVGVIGGAALGQRGIIHKTHVRKPSMLIGLFDFTNLMKFFPNNQWHKKFYYLDSSQYGVQDVDAVSGGYMLLNKKVAIEAGLFDERFFMYLEDIDFCLRVRKCGFRVLFDPQSIIYHEGGASSPNKDRINFDAWLNSRRIFFKLNHGLFTNFVLQPLFFLDELIMRVWRIVR